MKCNCGCNQTFDNEEEFWEHREMLALVVKWP
jgi:hypothetical protein